MIIKHRGILMVHEIKPSETLQSTEMRYFSFWNVQSCLLFISKVEIFLNFEILLECPIQYNILKLLNFDHLADEKIRSIETSCYRNFSYFDDFQQTAVLGYKALFRFSMH